MPLEDLSLPENDRALRGGDFRLLVDVELLPVRGDVIALGQRVPQHRQRGLEDADVRLLPVFGQDHRRLLLLQN